MDKYKNGKIYTIRNRNDDSLIYVGSTCQPLYKRLSQHKSDSKYPRCENYLLYKKINETDINDWYIELYIDYPCERKEQLTQREGQVIREIGTLNKQITGRTHKEWREENKEHIKERKKEYNETNKDKIKEYYETNKDKIKEYNETNKDKIKEKNKEYRVNNKEKIKENKKEYGSENILCECGCNTRKDGMVKHKRTNKHLDIMKELAKTQEQTI